jgi:agmatine deiminase
MTPAALGFSMPAEWSPQEAVWLSWPVDDPRHWGGAKRDLIWTKFAEIAAAISRHEPVRINAPGADHAAIAAACNRAKAVPEHVELFDHPHNDVWCRDHGPIFVKHRHTGETAITDWDFNAWGGKFPPYDLDNSIPKQVAASLGKQRFDGGMILEGGAIEINGCGQLLTTEAVLLNPNRNPHLSKQEIEQKLRDGLGVSDILWLKQGIEGDDTDGHIDDITRFYKPDGFITVVESNKRDPNHKILAENLERLNAFRTPQGKKFDIVELPMPKPFAFQGQPVPASYANFLIINGAVLVPNFRQKKRDAEANAIIASCFPGREIIPIDCYDLIWGLGTLHCISQQQPA